MNIKLRLDYLPNYGSFIMNKIQVHISIQVVIGIVTHMYVSITKLKFKATLDTNMQKSEETNEIMNDNGNIIMASTHSS